MTEPSYGFSGAMEMLSASRPAEGGGSLHSAASELSSAARGLQTSQGAMVNQTQAINQLNQMTQQQMQGLVQTMTNLNFSISQLSAAVNQSAGAQRMAAMSGPAPMAMPMAMGGGGGGGGGDYGGGGGGGGLGGGLSALASGARFAGGLAFGAGRMALQGMGSLVGMGLAPFSGATYQGPGPGQLMGTVGNAGFARSAAHGAGLSVGGFGRGVGANWSMATEAAADRAGFKAGEIGLGAIGGAANIMGGMASRFVNGGAQLGGMIGGGIGGAIGGQTGATMGQWGGTALGGFAVGGPMGAAAAVGALALEKTVAATVGRVMDQMGEIRGSGEMMGRNAFRFQGPNANRRMSQVERTRMGAGLQRTANEDLTFSASDMQEIFAGGIEQDMFRGVNNAQDVQRRMRDLKGTVKVIGQTLGMSVRESMDLMGQLQGVGVGPSAAAAMITGGGVQGLTRQESLRGQMNFSNRFQGTGLQGAGLLNLSTQSQDLGQTAMRNGVLSAERIAAVGGREGVNNVMGDVTMALAQSGLGTMNLAAGMNRGQGGVSRNALSALSQAGSAGNANDLVRFAANKTDMMRDAVNDPAFRMNMLAQASSIADQFKGMGSKKDRTKLALIALGEGKISEQQASAFLEMAATEPQAQRERLNELTRAKADLEANQLAENLNPERRINRRINRALSPVTEGLAMGAARGGDMVANSATAVRNAVFGVGPTVATRRSDVTMDAILGANKKGVQHADVLNAKPSKETKDAAKDAVRALAIDDDNDLKNLANIDDKDEKKAAAEKLVDKIAKEKGVGDDPAAKKAIAMALSEHTGQDVAGLLFGSGEGGVSAGDMKKLGAMNDEIRSAMSSTSDAGVMAAGGGAVGSLMAGAGIALTGGLMAGPMALAGLLGGAGAGSWMSKNQFDDETINKIGRSPAAKKLLAAKQKLAKGGLSSTETAKLQREINKAKGSLADEGVSDSAIQKLSGLEGSELDKVAKNLGDETTRAAAGFALAEQHGMTAAQTAAKEAGLGNLATELAGGSDNLSEALSSVNDLSDESKRKLSKAHGDFLIKAAGVTSTMTKEQLGTQIGEDVQKGMMNADGSVNVDAVQKYLVAKAGSSDSNAASTSASSDFTSEQLTQQAAMLAQIQQLNELIKNTAQVVKDLQ